MGHYYWATGNNYRREADAFLKWATCVNKLWVSSLDNWKQLRLRSGRLFELGDYWWRP
jgi:hypothetical protein